MRRPQLVLARRRPGRHPDLRAGAAATRPRRPSPTRSSGWTGAVPWDGIPGPRHDPGTSTVDYQALAYGDYVEAALANRFDLP